MLNKTFYKFLFNFLVVIVVALAIAYFVGAQS